MLNCGLHLCPQKCHQLSDHSNVKCEYMLHDKCPNGHERSWKCHQSVRGCNKCEAETRRKEKEIQKALKMQEKRARDEQEHAEHMARLDDMLVEERQRLKEAQLSRDRALAIEQKKTDLADAKAMNVVPSKAPSNSHSMSTTASTPPKAPESGQAGPTTGQELQPPGSANLAAKKQTTSTKKSSTQPPDSRKLTAPDWTKRRISRAKEDWEYQKRIGNAHNGDIDALMEMIGLEEVKLQILQIKAKVEVSIRQNADLSKDRLNIAFLGNPGTGKFPDLSFTFILSTA